MATDVYDALIVGGGPAGLSAAIYLGRALRRTIVLDAGDGRAAGPQVNENYLGFPRGVKASRLLDLGRKQAERFGVEFAGDRIGTASRAGGLVCLAGNEREWRGRTLILATGVTDVWPAADGVQRYIGRSLFWCITCDGFRTRGKRTVLIGATGEATTTALQFLHYTDQVTFVASCVGEEDSIAPDSLEQMRGHGVTVVESTIERFRGSRGQIRQVVTGDGVIDGEIVFSLLGHVPNAGLAAQLGVFLDERGYVKIDREQRTNVPCVYAAGDLTGPYAHQVASAVHEGAMAAQAANYDLYAEYQRH